MEPLVELGARLRFRLLQADFVFGLAFRGWIVSRYAFKLIFRGMELERRLVNSGWKSDEFNFPIRVSSGFEIEPADPAKAISHMGLNRSGIGGLSIGANHG